MTAMQKMAVEQTDLNLTEGRSDGNFAYGGYLECVNDTDCGYKHNN